MSREVYTLDGILKYHQKYVRGKRMSRGLRGPSTGFGSTSAIHLRSEGSRRLDRSNKPAETRQRVGVSVFNTVMPSRSRAGGLLQSKSAGLPGATRQRVGLTFGHTLGPGAV